MGIVLNWNSTYPGGGIDNTTTNFPVLADNIHDVLASHVNSLAAAIIELETAVGVNGGLTIREADSTPSVTPVHTIVVSNGSLTNLGNGSVQLAVGSGGSTSPFPFRPVAADFGTPAITGTITGGVTVTDVSGTSLGSVYDFVQIEATDPQAGAFVVIPITLPVTPFPDRFEFELTFFTGAPPSADFDVQLAFGDSTGDLFWNFYHSVDVAATSRPAFSIVEGDSGVVGATWDMPNLNLSNAIVINAKIEKVVPFTAIPQLKIEALARNFPANVAGIYCSASTAGPTSGTISPGAWVGADFEQLSLVIIYPNTIVGAQPLLMALEFLPHVKDR